MWRLRVSEWQVVNTQRGGGTCACELNAMILTVIECTYTLHHALHLTAAAAADTDTEREDQMSVDLPASAHHQHTLNASQSVSPSVSKFQ